MEIAKALAFDSKIAVFDEPSAVLTNREISELMHIIRDLKARGLSVIYISHRLEEAFEIGDRAAILRDGAFVREAPLSDINLDEIIKLMVGRELKEQFPKRIFPVGEEIFRVEHLSSGKHFQDVSFALHRGEVLGVAGLIGAGRTEVAKMHLWSASQKQRRSVFIRGKTEPQEALGRHFRRDIASFRGSQGRGPDTNTQH
ncbi:MAG: hypothetical protein LBU32_09175 [Clostridiales bacterium]|nr:hypothetical protein [Clostridiales bacterium]